MTTRRPIVSYLRVIGSHDDLGIEAQREAIRRFAEDNGFRVVEEIVEEADDRRGVGMNRRPQLSTALRHVRKRGCPIVVARLGCLSRDARVIEELVPRETQLIVAADPPFTLQVYRSWTADQRARHGRRVKRTLAARKAQGVKLGNPTNLYEAGEAGRRAQVNRAREFAAEVLPIIDEIRASGVTSFNGIAKELNRRGVRTARGGRWAAMTVKRVVERGRVSPRT